jgi:hypothetical protein
MMNGSRPRLLQSPGDDVAKFRLSWVFPASVAADLPRIMPWRASIGPKTATNRPRQ